MPTVEKVSGGLVRVRDIGQFRVGDRVEVSADEAAYLCDERGDFERVGEADDEGSDVEDGAGYLREEPPSVQIDEGVCPWCPPDERYEGDAVGQHASAAHPDEWADYKED